MGTDGRWGWWTLMMTDADANRRWGTLMLTDAGGRWCGQWQTLMMSYDADGRWCWWSPQPKFFDGGSVFPKRLSTENILQPTRSLYDVWLKSYGSLCVFHVWGDLDLRPFKVIIYVWGQYIPISVYKKYWKFSVAEFLWYDCTLQKPMYCPCDLDLWPMKVNYFFVNWLSAYKCPV